MRQTHTLTFVPLREQALHFAGHLLGWRLRENKLWGMIIMALRAIAERVKFLS